MNGNHKILRSKIWHLCMKQKHDKCVTGVEEYCIKSDRFWKLKISSKELLSDDPAFHRVKRYVCHETVDNLQGLFNDLRQFPTKQQSKKASQISRLSGRLSCPTNAAEGNAQW